MTMMLVIIMRFRIARERHSEWEGFVRKRSKAVQQKAGFQRMYLLRPVGQEEEYRVVSWWEGLENPEAWIRKEVYAYSEDADHQGIVVGPVGHEILRIVQEY